MQIQKTKISDVYVVEPKVFGDDRGYFFESFNAKVFAEQTGFTGEFVQDNQSSSQKNVLRGLHYQIQQPQGKLVRALTGSILDVAVDIRRSSPTFGQWVAYELSAVNKRQLWVPAGFAHGFVVLSEMAEVAYKTTDYYAPQHERSIQWNDPDLAIDWQIGATPMLSAKDQAGVPLKSADLFD